MNERTIRRAGKAVVTDAAGVERITWAREFTGRRL
jgi:hypothetical protein